MLYCRTSGAGALSIHVHDDDHDAADPMKALIKRIGFILALIAVIVGAAYVRQEHARDREHAFRCGRLVAYDETWRLLSHTPSPSAYAAGIMECRREFLPMPEPTPDLATLLQDTER